MLLEELKRGHDLVVDRACSEAQLIAAGHEVEHIVPCRVLDVLLLVRSAQERIERVAIGQVRTRLALHPHVAQIRVDRIADLGLGRGLGFSPTLFTMLVVMALVTTMCTTPILDLLGIQKTNVGKIAH